MFFCPVLTHTTARRRNTNGACVLLAVIITVGDTVVNVFERARMFLTGLGAHVESVYLITIGPPVASVELVVGGSVPNQNASAGNDLGGRFGDARGVSG